MQWHEGLPGHGAGGGPSRQEYLIEARHGLNQDEAPRALAAVHRGVP